MALENKLGITSSPELAEAEERISKKKALELFENGILDTLEAGKFSALKAIHKYLFEDIYDFAGEVRTVNIAKGNFCLLYTSPWRMTLFKADKPDGAGLPISAQILSEAIPFIFWGVRFSGSRFCFLPARFPI